MEHDYQWYNFTPEQIASKDTAAVRNVLRRMHHVNDIVPQDYVEVCIDMRQQGVAGYDSWGDRPEPQYRLPADRDYTWGFTLRCPSGTPGMLPGRPFWTIRSCASCVSEVVPSRSGHSVALRRPLWCRGRKALPGITSLTPGLACGPTCGLACGLAAGLTAGGIVPLPRWRAGMVGRLRQKSFLRGQAVFEVA